MSDSQPVACSLDSDGLAERGRELARLGETALLGAKEADGVHVLRFRDDPPTQEKLEAVVRAERECCPFLDLTLEEGEDALVLRIGTPPEGRDVADGLASAIRGDASPGPAPATPDRRPLLAAAVGALALVCCLAGPLLLGAAAGTLLGGALEVAALALAAAAIVLVVRWRRARARKVGQGRERPR